MAEFVLGLGIQKSVREVVALVEPELVRTEGVPKRIRIHAGPIEVVAERPDYSGDFTVFALRLRTTEKCQQKIRTVVEEYSDCSTLGETDDVFEVHCPPAGIESSARSLEAVDKVSACVTLPEVWRVEGDRYRTDPISAELIFQASGLFREIVGVATQQEDWPGDDPLVAVPLVVICSPRSTQS